MTKANLSPPPAKHIPQRTCIACRKTGPKREMVRLVSLPGGGLEIDLTGKKSGRGAYLCSTSRSCWEKVIKSGQLENALRTSIRPEDREKLVNYVKEINNTSS